MARRQEMRGISEEPSAACFASSPSRGALPRWPSAVMLSGCERAGKRTREGSTRSSVRRAFGARRECEPRER